MPIQFASCTKPAEDPLAKTHFSDHLREFGRIRDVEHLFGIKRGTVYNLLNDRKIQGVLLPVRGQRSGVRLIYIPSVRDYIMKEMGGQNINQSSQPAN